MQGNTGWKDRTSTSTNTSTNSCIIHDTSYIIRTMQSTWTNRRKSEHDSIDPSGMVPICLIQFYATRVV